MLIKNLTNKTQELELKELVGDRRVHTIYVAPKGTTEVSFVSIVNAERYAGIFEIEGVSVQSNKSVAKPVVVEEVATEVVEEELPKEEHVPEVNESAFICDVCGAEFASARGLAAHKNKAHSA